MSDLAVRRSVPDPVGVAARLRSEMADRVGAAVGLASTSPDEVHVGWFAALDASGCPARYRGRGETGWSFPGWSPGLAGGPIARAALDHHMTMQPSGRLPGEPPAPLPTVRAWMRSVRRAPDSSVGEWVAERARDGDAATLAAAAAAAARWLAGFLRVVGWPLPPRLALAVERPARWRPSRSSPVAVASGADAHLGRVTMAGRFAVLVHRVTSGDDGGALDRAAFEATATALGGGIAPGEVIVSAGDTGERLRFEVDDALLARGADLTELVVRERARAVDETDPDHGATPSAACRWCERLDECGPGRSWRATAQRWRGGLPLLPGVPGD
ncbi:MAG: hypothetical protein ACLFXM_15880 [Acidimicrobiia bacterium]